MSSPDHAQNQPPPYKTDVDYREWEEEPDEASKAATAHLESLDRDTDNIYAEALARYPNDESIDMRDEKKVRRKLDSLILPLLGGCYFFYYVDKTTLCVSLQLSRPNVYLPDTDHVRKDLTPPSSV